MIPTQAEFELIGNMFDIFGVPEADRSGGPLGDNRTPILTLNPLWEFDTSTIIDEKHWQHHAQDIWHLIVAYIFTPHVQDPDNGTCVKASRYNVIANGRRHTKASMIYLFLLDMYMCLHIETPLLTFKKNKTNFQRRQHIKVSRLLAIG